MQFLMQKLHFSSVAPSFVVLPWQAFELRPSSSFPPVFLRVRPVRPAQHRDGMLHLHDGLPGHGEVPGGGQAGRVPHQRQQREALDQVRARLKGVNNWARRECQAGMAKERQKRHGLLHHTQKETFFSLETFRGDQVSYPHKTIIRWR